MPATATSGSASTSPRVFTPSQAAVVALHAAASSPITSSPKPRSRCGSFVPLQRFDCIRVAKKLRRDGRRVYVVSVFLQRNEARRRLSESVYKASPASKLSAEGMRAFMMAEREPDYSAEHPFFEFRELRDSVAALVRAKGVHVKTCADCQDLLRVLLNPKHQHWTVRRMFGNKEQRFALLTTFVNDLLTLTTSAGERTSIPERLVPADKDCQVRERVGELMQEFLRRERKDSLGII
ncbi:hypothetical protein PHYPSEUDO_007306 [Phytophthora pseudosyringae]|uniref:Uncharacterized protein n=1 Tax=Phytophthora pseudosyringae TaxID=221518 RepID=A0A8T1VLQ6_9STRA|nr:hypothetical protein PHYPSEUDO_007306 [Phytophthora pseudosyringae]